ncbi:RNA polymerase sigma factor [Clostridiisalibacter paucivorans]|uniref:RNA polymerase sigma factor n=1 Tax=Clostridiisalibacter paucivorans TaxID=408753 RepID=UPI000479E70B|nr:RNA polymerase sigma factor [Clostridiisalibacter paucivorans]
MNEDKVLMTKFQNGDKYSFEQLILKYRNTGISFAKRFLHDRYMAEDVVQESFAYIYVYRDRYNDKYSFKTYLFTIIRNKSIDYIRKENRIVLYKDDSFVDLNSPEERVIEKEDKDLLNISINKLNDSYRTAIYLIDYEGFKYKEAAKIMGKNLAQMKILIYRARKKLKCLLEKGGY